MAQSDAAAPGLSGHIHLSLRDSAGQNLFCGQPESPSPTAAAFIAGVLHLLPECLALPLHTVNAYRRLSPGNWAPRTATWSHGGYTTAVRAVCTDEPSARLEFRIPGADVNPYLGLSMFLAAGLWGIEHALPLPPPATGDGRLHHWDGMRELPRDLRAAADALEASAAAREMFGETFLGPYVASRRHEHDSLRRAVSIAEKARYFEIA
jgi:glutamine synthetase